MTTSQLLSWVFKKLGQPTVVGEMIAGILLGPSLLGWVAPATYQALFPKDSLAAINLAGQLGLVCYMFLVGATLDVAQLREKRGMALVASLSSIMLPFGLGLGLALRLHARFGMPGSAPLAFALCFGVCLSITAFPVLARILRETKMSETPLGVVAITCAALDDVVAWLVLAGVLSYGQSAVRHHSLWLTLASLMVYVPAMLIFRSLCGRYRWLRHDTEASGPLALALLVAIVSSAATECIGLHAVFGAFFAGVVMPRNAVFADHLRRTIEPLCTVVLLPLFFAFTGLRTQFRLAVSGHLWLYTALIIAVAIGGKFLGASCAARCMGMSLRESVALGILMNTRGLVELVVLNIGYDAGLLSPEIFAMLVMMAIITTLMTTPLLNLALPQWRRELLMSGVPANQAGTAVQE